jgi:hypothetical protein
MHPRDQSTGDPANSTGPTDGQHWGPAHQARYRAELGQGSEYCRRLSNDHLLVHNPRLSFS